MTTPAWIRYYAATSDDAIGMVALAYLRSLIRIAPVRLLTFHGGLFGPWTQYQQLLTTPMPGVPHVNCVCTDPSRWTWHMALNVPKQQIDPRAAMVPGGDPALGGDGDLMQGTMELYTMNLRNVLFAPTTPRSRAELGTALRYEALVVPGLSDVTKWRELGGAPRLVPTPVSDHRAVRDAVCPT